MITLMAFTSVLLSSCSVEYRERHRRHDDGHDHNRDHHYYQNYHQ
ncbi:hypothetical protein C8P68_101436 [Mucilaginibacter yixingensis]|uniref:Uncharacterized protein n=2 Tax=Mucilaginibacter yixingensis TaxID=1295612 RepID=A0A2T5JFJ5_9SPHI|nr:hypothetical protein C8P68_101436 [Mucilaginibacter yixingensis]